MLELLSDVLRQVLRTDETHETALSREVEFLKQYLAIERVRFSDRLRPRFDIDPAVARAAIPRFLLQPLVENALRHGIARRADAGLVQVSAHREGNELVLTVRDDGPGLLSTADVGAGVGLSNTRARLLSPDAEEAALGRQEFRRQGSGRESAAVRRTRKLTAAMPETC